MTPPRNETLKSDYGRQSAPGADSWHLESAATSSLKEKGASILPDSWKDVRDAKRRESEWKKSSEKGESPVGGENGGANGNAPHQEAEQEAPCHCIWQRSGVTTGDVRRMREHRSLGARRERDVTEPTKPLVPEAGPGGTDCPVELLTQEAETSMIPRRPRGAKVTP